MSQHLPSGGPPGYDESSFDEDELRSYARRVASSLKAEGRPQRPPKHPLKRTVQTRTGFFGRRRPVDTWEGGIDEPKFWVVKFHPKEAWSEQQPGGGCRSFEEGEALLLLDGDLVVADYHDWWGGGTDAVEIVPHGLAGTGFLLWLDNSRGRWRQRGPRGAERWDYQVHNLPSTHAKGVGASKALNGLLRNQSGPLAQTALETAPMPFNFKY